MYTKITAYGGQTINYIHTKSGIDSSSDINTFNNSGFTKPIWTNKTIALSTFQGTDISASSLNSLLDIVGYKIYRKNKIENILYYVGTFDSDKVKISDYNICNGRTYQYYIYPIYLIDGVEQIGNPIITDYTTTDWEYWSIIGTKETSEKNVYIVDTDNIWTFGLSVKSNGTTPQIDKTIYNGLYRFPRISQGKRNYKEGGISCYFGDVDNVTGEYINDTTELVDKWIEFVNNGELKLLKDIKGDVIPCDIKDSQYQYSDEFIQIPITLSFNYIQLDDMKNISVYGV